MTGFRVYTRTGTAEMRPVTEKEASEGFLAEDNISVSYADALNGSPKVGDMIARNPKDHTDKWLVAEEYFKENFRQVGLNISSGPGLMEMVENSPYLQATPQEVVDLTSVRYQTQMLDLSDAEGRTQIDLSDFDEEHPF